MGLLKDLLKSLLAQHGFHAALLVAGVLFFIVGYHSVSGDLSKPQLTPVEPRYVLIIPGFLLICGAFLLALVDKGVGPLRGGNKIRETATGFAVGIRDLQLRIDFGVLQDLYQPSNRDAAVVLPANEFFDDKCFSDGHTAAGAFVRKHYLDPDVGRLHGYVHNELRSHKSVQIEGKLSYGVGTCVYVGEAAGWPVRSIFAAIATNRQPQGLQAEPGTLFKAVSEIRCILAQQRLTEVFLPLLGAGKGGLPPSVALMSLLTALLDARSREGGHHLGTVHVVIYQAADGAPQVPHRVAKNVLGQVVSLFHESR